jgi:hypothetical protein
MLKVLTPVLNAGFKFFVEEVKVFKLGLEN